MMSMDSEHAQWAETERNFYRLNTSLLLAVGVLHNDEAEFLVGVHHDLMLF